MDEITPSRKVSGIGLVNSLLKAANGGDEEGPVARYMREKKVRKAIKRLKAGKAT